MTSEDILELEPGPELDRLVAERVVGWSDAKDVSKYYPGDGVWRSPDGHPLHGERWSPSSDIAAAWEVVDHLASKGFSFTLLQTGENHFLVKVWNNDPGWNRVKNPVAFEIGPAPLAICRAALLTVMKEVGR